MVLPRHSFSKKKNSTLSHGPRCSRPPFSNSPPRGTYPRIFSRLSTSIYAYGEAVDPNLQRHPYAKMVRHTQGSPTCGPYSVQGPLSFTQPSTSPPSPLHIQQVEPNLQRHSYTTTSKPPYAKMCV